ncbi:MULTISPECIES: single-stranded DNA-binding protein [Aerococcus]|uniref:Single-stranded DNA-binding protein n=1 Tax=Aerococcus sanguinicola TaxID=119206 RepID=A0A5N1GN78_9LACT|nr:MULTISPECIES: single-stranded DNA-binding protein [Aerococcus]KAA9302252.1 single-stranded DNA-binding protein [Aerococcus sanguinicola]MDK6369005.1 single-stranded DNA-binding protein [Aerococcus sp. UMB9870]MDK6678907.1 single-stranded DNA-binding protein [Aerococcus sp. UMB8608]MDK6686774.1 single-stranded DNA-binding protein [Aerococcus sp. UMB8623]MDK6939566.1 single-stranded DNA-binding protein [Aerococcus sp. UMB8487]
MNQVACIGRLAVEVEIKDFPNGNAVLNNLIAINRHTNQKQEADFIPIVAWNGTARLIAKYLEKGDEIGLVGRIQSRRYETKEGRQQTAIEIVISDVTFLRKKLTDTDKVMTIQVAKD